MIIRKIGHKDFPEASKLLWETFYFVEKNNTAIEGMETFRDLISPISLDMNTFDGTIEIFGAFENKALCGVCAVKEKKHILLLYVHKDMLGMGIGTKLLAFAEKKCISDIITLNSSDYGLNFYLSKGYKKMGNRSVKDGIIFTPMQK